MTTRTRGLLRLLRVFVACVAFLVVEAPAPAAAPGDLVVLVSRATASPGHEREHERDREVAIRRVAARAAPLAAAPLTRDATPDPTGDRSKLVLVPDKYLRHCSFLC